MAYTTPCAGATWVRLCPPALGSSTRPCVSPSSPVVHTWWVQGCRLPASCPPAKELCRRGGHPWSFYSPSALGAHSTHGVCLRPWGPGCLGGSPAPKSLCLVLPFTLSQCQTSDVPCWLQQSEPGWGHWAFKGHQHGLHLSSGLKTRPLPPRGRGGTASGALLFPRL